MERQVGGRTVTAPRARRRLALADDGIIDPIAVEIAARGARTVALTPAERQLAAARILARGGTACVISKRLHVSGTTALLLAARCHGHVVPGVLAQADGRNGVIATGSVPEGQTAGAVRAEGGDGGWTPPGQAQEMPDRKFHGAGPAGVPGRQVPTGKVGR
jgi:hypothetical protein